ncbi:hypothetical protein U1Q18_008195, partial [Sarracenia purpurea var. burkii]
AALHAEPPQRRCRNHQECPSPTRATSSPRHPPAHHRALSHRRAIINLSHSIVTGAPPRHHAAPLFSVKPSIFISDSSFPCNILFPPIYKVLLFLYCGYCSFLSLI